MLALLATDVLDIAGLLAVGRAGSDEARSGRTGEATSRASMQSTIAKTAVVGVLHTGLPI